jgi:16S rRNA (adenine1518-N6/adenine1519-N6)-dimethyltransferase
MPADNSQELFDICDADDNVVGQAPRGEVHARGLLHRAVHIFVFNSAGEFLVHRRSATKDEFPLRITSSASGHVSAGEGYDETAVRELKEELGLQGRPEYQASFPAGPETANEHTRLYRIVTDKAPTPDPDEIASLEFANIESVRQRIAADPDDFTPPFRLLFAWYVEQAPSARSPGGSRLNG